MRDSKTDKRISQIIFPATFNFSAIFCFFRCSRYLLPSRTPYGEQIGLSDMVEINVAILV